MYIQLDEKVAEKVVELAISMGFTPSEMVDKIVQWFFEDCEKEK